MKKIAAVLFFVLLSVMFAGSVIRADNQENDGAKLDVILQEIKLLHSAIERLEKRIELLETEQTTIVDESTIHLQPERWLQPRETDVEAEPISIEQWHRHEMPWKPNVPQIDNGLYNNL
jgi:hypothetical protein